MVKMIFNDGQLSSLLEKLQETANDELFKIINQQSGHIGQETYINVRFDTFYDNKKIKEIDVVRPGSHISIYKHKQEVDFTVVIANDGVDEIEGQFSYEYIVPQLWSKTWWKWRKLSKTLEKALRIQEKRALDAKVEKDSEHFNNVFHTLFPDEIDKILLKDK